jgi:wyosine [tRNA(Phe)-imidazoG37] synthetase (radical SAM superfamily)
MSATTSGEPLAAADLTIFGPVPSRRLGQSLGIGNVPAKTCSYSCVYCQVGPTPATNMEPHAFWRAFQRFAQRLPRVELLTGFEGTAFGSTGDAERDLLAITAVHPMREDSVVALLAKCGADRTVLNHLMADSKLRPVIYRDHVFYLRRFA